MGFALIAHTGVAHANTGGGVTITTTGITTTGANLIVVEISSNGVTVANISLVDSNSNIWTKVPGTLGNSAVFYCVSPTVGAGHTFTGTTTAANNPTITVSAWSGVDTVTPFDKAAQGNGSTSAASVTPANNNSLVIATAGPSNSNFSSTVTGYTITDNLAVVSFGGLAGAMAYQIQTTATATQAIWSATSFPWAVVFNASVPTVNIPVPLATMAMTEYSPALKKSIPIPLQTMAFTGFAPTIGAVLTIAVPATSLVTGAFAPGLVRTIPVPVRALGLTTYIPFISPFNISVPAAHLTTATFAPTVTGSGSIEVPTGSLLTNTFAPLVIIANLGDCAERFGPKLYYWEPSYLERPEDTFLRATDWENAGYQGLKFVQGFILEADTEGDTRQIMIQGDQNDIELITINHNGQIQKPYSLNIPVQAHLLRILPMDTSVHWRLFHVRWVYEPAPEFAKEWKTQGTDHDIPGFMFLKDIYIAHNSTQDITLRITVDGALFTYTIPNSGGQFKKDYLLLALANSGLALKGTLFTYELTSPAPFQLFQKDCEVRVHAWAGGDYMVKLPFGDISRVNGARI